MYNFKESFGQKIHCLRKYKGLTIESFAEKLELSSRQVTRIESGENFPSAETICKICMVLDTDAKTLFDFEWNDNLMYFSSGKMQKPNFKVVKCDDKAFVTQLTCFENIDRKIKEVVSALEIKTFLVEVAQKNNECLFVELFEKKERKKIIKVLPNGKIENVLLSEDINDSKNAAENKHYGLVVEKIKLMKHDEKKLKYINLAIDALKNKKALAKIISILQTISMVQG